MRKAALRRRFYAACYNGKLRMWRAFSSLVIAAILFTGCSRTPEQKEAGFLQSGQKHLQARDFQRAVLDFKNAAQVMPRDPEPHYQLGLAYLSSGNQRAALQELLNSVDLDPKHVGALLKLAEIMTASKNPDVVKEGKQRAQQVLALSPDSADALQMLAKAEYELGDPQIAEQHLQQALERVPQHLNAALTLAMVKLRAKDISGAEQVMQQAAAGAPKSAEHAVALGRFYLLTGKSAEAEKEFWRALEIDPKTGPALTALASLCYRDGRTAQADQLLQRASALPDKAYRPLHASFLLETGKSAAAVTEFEQLYKKDHANRDARTRLVAAYLRTGRTTDAGNVLADALKQDSKDMDARLQRGELYLAQGKYAEAQDDLTAVLRDRPESPEAHFVMARVLKGSNAPVGQMRELSEALRLNPKFLEARLELARALSSRNAPKAAIELLDQTPEEERQTLSVIVERNTALFTLGDYAEMRKGVDRGLAIARSTELLLQDGLLRMKQHDYEGGRASLKETLKWQSEEWRALEALALSYVAEKKPAEATAIVQEYTDRVPNSVAAKQFRGLWLLKMGDRVGARAALLAARSMADPKTAEAVDFQLAELDLREGNLDIARNSLTALLREQPGNVAVILDLAQTEFRAGRLTETLGYYQKALEHDPGNLSALNNLAYLLADTGKDPVRALILAERAKELAPADPTIDDTIGWAYYNLGKFEEAVKYLSLSKTTTPRWKCHLAMAYIKTGKRPQAVAMLQAALKEDPNLAEARKVQALLAAK
jgi:tetratricopeptide (TPR) repeat protein